MADDNDVVILVEDETFQIIAEEDGMEIVVEAVGFNETDRALAAQQASELAAAESESAATAAAGSVMTISAIAAAAAASAAAAAASVVTAAALASYAASYAMNGKIVESHTAFTVTYALKTVAGNNPSLSDPVIVVFASASGLLTVRQVTAATSITLSSGSSLGSLNAPTAFQTLIIAIDNAGTVELGLSLRGAYTSAAGNGVNGLYFDESKPYSTTAEGGAGGADTPGTIYSATARTNKYMRILARADYDSGISVGGSWDASPDRIVLNAPNIGSFLLPPSFTAHKNSTDQVNLSHAAYTKLTFPYVRFNVGGVFDTTNSRAVFPPGLIEISAAVWLKANVKDPPTIHTAKIIKNGSIDIGTGSNGWASAGVANSAGSVIPNVRDISNFGDYYELHTYGESSTSVNNITCDGNPAHVFFSGARVSA